MVSKLGKREAIWRGYVIPNLLLLLRVASHVVQVEGFSADIGMGMCGAYAHKPD